MTNVFASAKTVVDNTPKKKGEKEEVFIKDLDSYAALDALKKSIEGVGDIYKNSIKDVIIDHFVDKTLLSHARPGNFKGIGLYSSASCELRKRSSKSPLSATEVAILKQYKVSTETSVVSPAKEESFIMSPELTEAINKYPKLAEQLSNSIMKIFGGIPELRGKDFILRVAAKEAETVETVSDQTFLDVAQLTSADALRQVYGIIGTPSISPEMTTDDLSTTLKIVEGAGLTLKTDNKKKKSK